jgi:hypothetical protein
MSPAVTLARAWCDIRGERLLSPLALFGHGATPGLSLYTTAKNLAQQLRHSAVVSLVSKSLAEGENADQLLNQVARTLMSVAKMPQAMEP